MSTEHKKTRRRQRNTGSLREIAHGKWQLRYKGASEIALAASKTTAKEKLEAFVERVRNGGVASGEHITFNDLADLYLESKARSKEATTLAWYRRNLKHHVRPAIGDLRLRELKPVHVQRLLDGARDTSRTKHKGQPLGSTSLRNLLIGVRAVLAWGVKQGLLRDNVASKVDLPHADHIERPTLTPDDAALILRAAHGSELFPVVVTAIATGLRRSELCALRWSDLNLEAGTIEVRRAAANVGGSVIVKSTKTHKSQRTDHLPAFVVTRLPDHKRAQLAVLEKIFGEFDARRRQKDGYVFARGEGIIWDPNELSRAFARFIRRKKLPAYRFHDLRHGYASLAFAAGVPLAVVSRSLGHASIGITADIYTHLLADQKREKAEVLDNYLGQIFESQTEKTAHSGWLVDRATLASRKTPAIRPE